VQLPYLGLALTLFVLAGAVALLNLPRILSAEGEPGRHSLLDVVRVRHLALGAVAIFVYVGAEVLIGSFIVNFLEQPGLGGMDLVTAARHVSLYWGGAMVGRPRQLAAAAAAHQDGQDDTRRFGSRCRREHGHEPAAVDHPPPQLCGALEHGGGASQLRGTRTC
jgi:hypothetical protein